MEFIIVLVSAIIYRNSGTLAKFQRDDWLVPWSQTVDEFSIPQRAKLLLLVGLPIVGAMFVFWFVGGAVLGLLEFVLSLLLILYALGRFGFDEVLQRYISSMGHSDTQAALHSLAESGYAEPSDDLVALHYEFEYELVYNEFQRWFGVIFWFLVMGPVAALFYRLVRTYSDNWEELRIIESVMEWVPVRLLGVSWALVGNFDDIPMRWEDSLEHGLDSGASLHAFTCCELPPDLTPQMAVDRSEQLLVMFKRATILWVVAAALLVLIF